MSTPANLASRKVLLRNGFSDDGHGRFLIDRPASDRSLTRHLLLDRPVLLGPSSASSAAVRATRPTDGWATSICGPPGRRPARP